jgi:hypothetical protein
MYEYKSTNLFLLCFSPSDSDSESSRFHLGVGGIGERRLGRRMGVILKEGERKDVTGVRAVAEAGVLVGVDCGDVRIGLPPSGLAAVFGDRVATGETRIGDRVGAARDGWESLDD